MRNPWSAVSILAVLLSSRGANGQDLPQSQYEGRFVKVLAGDENSAQRYGAAAERVARLYELVFVSPTKRGVIVLTRRPSALKFEGTTLWGAGDSAVRLSSSADALGLKSDWVLVLPDALSLEPARPETCGESFSHVLGHVLIAAERGGSLPQYGPLPEWIKEGFAILAEPEPAREIRRRNLAKSLDGKAVKDVLLATPQGGTGGSASTRTGTNRDICFAVLEYFLVEFGRQFFLNAYVPLMEARMDVQESLEWSFKHVETLTFGETTVPRDMNELSDNIAVWYGSGWESKLVTGRNGEWEFTGRYVDLVGSNKMAVARIGPYLEHMGKTVQESIGIWLSPRKGNKQRVRLQESNCHGCYLHERDVDDTLQLHPMFLDPAWPHEFGHGVLHNFFEPVEDRTGQAKGVATGPIHRLSSSWLDEGFSDSLTPLGIKEERRAIIKAAIQQANYIRLENFFRLCNPMVSPIPTPDGLMDGKDMMPQPDLKLSDSSSLTGMPQAVYYPQSLSMVEFLLQQYGGAALRKCMDVAFSGGTVEEFLTYLQSRKKEFKGTKVPRGIEELEDFWKRWVLQNY